MDNWIIGLIAVAGVLIIYGFYLYFKKQSNKFNGNSTSEKSEQPTEESIEEENEEIAEEEDALKDDEISEQLGLDLIEDEAEKAEN